MGQEQSYVGPSGIAQVKGYKEKYEDPIPYRSSHVDYHDNVDNKYKRLKARRSAESFKSDSSSNVSSGYRSASSVYEYNSDRSSKSEYHSPSLYKNDHYRDVSKELYKPVKIPKEKRYKLQLFEVNNEDIKSYRNDIEKPKCKTGPPIKKPGIRNYTPKILSEDEQRNKIENWI